MSHANDCDDDDYKDEDEDDEDDKDVNAEDGEDDCDEDDILNSEKTYSKFSSQGLQLPMGWEFVAIQNIEIQVAVK